LRVSTAAVDVIRRRRIGNDARHDVMQ